MENKNYNNKDENRTMIVLGILFFYILVLAFIIYLCFLHRITEMTAIISIIIFTLIYLPRFLIIKKIKYKDTIKILDNSIKINNIEIPFSEITDFHADEKKPQVVFFLNSKMIVFYEAIFHLKLTSGQISFIAIGSEKISLLKEFFNELLKNNRQNL